MTTSQSSITFFVALLALLAHFTDDIRSSISSFRDWVSGTNFSMNAALVDIDQAHLTVILSSRRNYAFGVSKATCVVNLPVDRREFNLSRIERRGSINPAGPDEQQWIGQILLGYELETPEFFQPFETRMITFDRVLAGFPGTEIVQSLEEPTSFCTVMGADQHNSWAVSALITDAEHLTQLDALDFLQGQTELDHGSSEVEEGRRLQLINEIEQIRRQNEDEPTE